jgi:hypothetical protein
MIRSWSEIEDDLKTVPFVAVIIYNVTNERTCVFHMLIYEAEL